MTGIREAYRRFKAREKETRGMHILCAPDMDAILHYKLLYPGANIFIPGPEGDETNAMRVVHEGRWDPKVHHS